MLGGTVPGVRGDTAARASRTRASAREHRLGGVGAAARAHRRPPERPYRGRDDRPRARRGAARVDDRPLAAAVDAGARRAARARACWSTSTTAACASRCRSYCATLGRVRRAAAAADPAPPRARRGSPSWNFPREDEEPEHQLVFGGVRAFDELLARAPRDDERGEGWDRASRPASAGSRGGCGTACSRCEAMTGERVTAAPFDVCGPLPDRRDRARGERGHRQDVHDRRARGALRRRGHAARASCCSSPSRAWRPASCASACASGSSSAERGLDRALAGAPPTATRSCALLADGPREVVGCAGGGSPRALADFDAATIATTHGFCQEVLGGLGVAGDVEPDATFVEDVGDLVERGRRRPLRAPLPPRRDAGRSTARRRCAIAPRRGRQPGRADRAARRARRRAPAMRAPAAPRRSATSSSAASGALGGDDLRRPAHAAATTRSPSPAATSRPRGCASATASCSSTSSRTPTRSSGTSCAARSATAARRWC